MGEAKRRLDAIVAEANASGRELPKYLGLHKVVGWPGDPGPSRDTVYTRKLYVVSRDAETTEGKLVAGRIAAMALAMATRGVFRVIKQTFVRRRGGDR